MKNKIYFYLGCLSFALASAVMQAQNLGISATGSAPSGDAGLDVSFSDKGVLIPRVNLTSLTSYAPITGGGPTESMLVYNTNTTTGKGYYYWNGSRWVKLLVTGVPADAWLTTGNAGTTAGTHFVGTTDNVDLVFKTNNTERMRINNAGFVGVNTVPSNVFQFAVVSTTNAVTGQSSGAGAIGVYGLNSTSTGFGVQGFNSNASGTGVLGSGNNIGAMYLAGGSGGAFSSTNVGVYGYGNTTSLSYGVYGVSDATNGDGVVGWSNAAAGTGSADGVFGRTAQSGGFGVWGVNANGTGVGIAGAGANIGTTYYAGVGGAFSGTPLGLSAVKDGAATNNQGAGIFIYSSTANTGVYVAYRAGATNYKIVNIAGFGGTASTDVWGMEGKKDARIMFCPEAPEIYFMDAGIGQLKNGKAHIDIDPILSRNIVVNEKFPLKVFIQLNGECNGVYVTNRSSKGFDVIELNNGTSNAEFTWYILANRADYIDPETGELISKHEGVRFPLAPQPPKMMQKEAKDITKEKSMIIFEKK